MESARPASRRRSPPGRGSSSTTTWSRLLFRRLSVFVGGFTLEAAESVGAGDGVEQSEVLGLLVQLVDKSLVTLREHHGAARYHMLDTLRQYAWERLAEAGEAATLRDRHRDWCLVLTAGSDYDVPGFDETLWGDRIALEHDNVRAALAWCLERDPQSGLQLAVNMSRFWEMRGSHNEGGRWLDAALARAPERTRLRARALESVATEAKDQGDYLAWASASEEALAISGEIDDIAGMGTATTDLGYLAVEQGDYARGRTLLGEGMRLARQGDDEPGYCFALSELADLCWWEGDYQGAREAVEEFPAIVRKRADAIMIGWGMVELGGIICSSGDLARVWAEGQAMTLDQAVDYALAAEGR